MKPFRTALFAPGSKERVMAKAAESGADAVIFDLDGVITRTARVHAAAWKAMFDEYLRRRARSLR